MARSTYKGVSSNKLSEADLYGVYHGLEQGETHKVLAYMVGVSVPTIASLAARWGLPKVEPMFGEEPIPTGDTEPTKPIEPDVSIFLDVEIRKIKRMHNDGVSAQDIALCFSDYKDNDFDLLSATVNHIVDDIKFSHIR